MTTANLTSGTMSTDPMIPYATPAPRPAARGWAGTAIILGGLTLVGLAGCFLIGVMSVVNPNVAFNNAPPPSALTQSQAMFVAVLYFCCFVCFVGGAVMLFLGTRSLLRLMRA